MAKKTSVKSKGRKPTPSTRKAGPSTSRRAGPSTSLRAGSKKKASKGGRAKAAMSKGRKKAVRRASGAAKAAKVSRKKAARKIVPARKATPARKKTPVRKAAPARKAPIARAATPRPKTKAVARRGGTGRESELAQTPETGRTVRGRTNPMKTVRSTGTPAGAGDSRTAPGLDRARRKLRDIEETVQGPPSSLDLDRTPSAARSGRRHLQDAIEESNETGPVLTGGDVDADWADAYAVGDEAPGGDNPTPDQDIVDDIGRALGVEYQDNEELKGADKIAERDRHRWELDPASSDDYKDRE
jgi:hypothetical protein